MWFRQEKAGTLRACLWQGCFMHASDTPAPNTALQLQRAPHTLCLHRGFPPPHHISLVLENLSSPPDIWRSLLSYCFLIFAHLDISYTLQWVLLETAKDKVFVFYLNWFCKTLKSPCSKTKAISTSQYCLCLNLTKKYRTALCTISVQYSWERTGNYLTCITPAPPFFFF